ncbi:hypothetical protein D3C86_1102800 [compost metagenome]
MNILIPVISRRFQHTNYKSYQKRIQRGNNTQEKHQKEFAENNLPFTHSVNDVLPHGLVLEIIGRYNDHHYCKQYIEKTSAVCNVTPDVRKIERIITGKQSSHSRFNLKKEIHEIHPARNSDHVNSEYDL